jgi:hypothetical protein
MDDVEFAERWRKGLFGTKSLMGEHPSGPGRYLAASVKAAGQNCILGPQRPLLDLGLGGSHTVSGAG